MKFLEHFINITECVVAMNKIAAENNFCYSCESWGCSWILQRRNNYVSSLRALNWHLVGTGEISHFISTNSISSQVYRISFRGKFSNLLIISFFAHVHRCLEVQTILLCQGDEEAIEVYRDRLTSWPSVELTKTQRKSLTRIVKVIWVKYPTGEWMAKFITLNQFPPSQNILLFFSFCFETLKLTEFSDVSLSVHDEKFLLIVILVNFLSLSPSFLLNLTVFITFHWTNIIFN